MKYVSREEFEERYPRKSARPSWSPGVENSTVFTQSLVIEKDARIQGIVHGDLRVASGTQAEVVGVIKGSARIDPDGVLYLTGVIEGGMQNDGSALLVGAVNGQITGGAGALFATGDRSWH